MMKRIITIVVAMIAVAAGVAAMSDRGEAESAAVLRYAVAAGDNFGLVVDQATGTVWRCEVVDVACDKLRLEE